MLENIKGALRYLGISLLLASFLSLFPGVTGLIAANVTQTGSTSSGSVYNPFEVSRASDLSLFGNDREVTGDGVIDYNFKDSTMVGGAEVPPLKESGNDGKGSLVRFNICIPKLTKGADSDSADFIDGSLDSTQSTHAYCYVSSIEEYIKIIYQYLIYIGGVGGTLMIVVGGFEIMISGYNDDFMARGTKKIWQAILGMIFLISISFLLHTVNPYFFQF